MFGRLRKEKLAVVTSIVFGPLWAPVIFWILYDRLFISTKPLFIFLILILQIIVPISCSFLIPYIKRGDKWDELGLKGRVKILFSILMTSLLVLLLAHLWGYQKIFNFNVFLIVLNIFIAIISNYWKISLHAVLNSGCILVINYFYNWEFWYLFLLIPIVLWSRLELKRHDIKQLVAGTFLPILLFLITTLWFPFR